MRHIASFIIIFLASVNAMAQSAFIGDWQGKVANIPIIIHVSNDDTGLKATLDSPSQGATGIPCGSVVVDGSSITIDMPALRASFKGNIATDNKTISGIFTQGAALPMTLTRSENAVATTIN